MRIFLKAIGGAQPEEQKAGGILSISDDTIFDEGSGLIGEIDDGGYAFDFGVIYREGSEERLIEAKVDI